MGIFTKLRSVFLKKGGASASSSDSVEQSSMITVYDKYGRQSLIPREEWQRKVLPDWIKQHWNDPDALYSTICMSLNDGFFAEVLGASERLLVIDPNHERSRTIRAIVLMNMGDLDGAEHILQEHIQHCGPTGTLLTNLAKVHAERGDQKQAEALLWEGLQLDPNQDNGLLWWAVIHRERDAQNGFTEAMRMVASIEGSWRPQLWLARECLEKKNLTEAKRYYDHVLKVAADQPDVLMMISGDLGKHGYVAEVLSIVLPLYDLEKHNPAVGHNILQAYLETKNYVEGEKFLHRMFALNRPDLKENLMFYSAEFDKLKEAARPDTTKYESPIDTSAVRIEWPIWYYGLKDPQWLFHSRNRSGKSVAFIALANSSPTNLTEITEQREDDLGRLTRSIPLYLMESLFFWTDTKPSVVIPIITGKGPIVSHLDWPPEHIEKFTEGVADSAIVGSIEQISNRLKIRLSVWDCCNKRVLKTFDLAGAREDFGTLVLKVEEQLLVYLAPQAMRATSPREQLYSRPMPQHMDRYLICLGQSLMGTLGHNKAISAERFWGERNMLDYCLATALEMNDCQMPRIVFLSSLAHNRACGSSIFQEFRQQSLALLEDEKNTESAFCRLSPLLLSLFDMHEEYTQRKTELLANADPLYRDWLDRLTEVNEHS